MGLFLLGVISLRMNSEAIGRSFSWQFKPIALGFNPTKMGRSGDYPNQKNYISPYFPPNEFGGNWFCFLTNLFRYSDSPLLHILKL